jgi:hypothetical protein
VLVQKIVSLSLISIALILSSSCSMFQRMGIGAASGVFYQASEEMETESNYQNFKNGLPPQLKMLEGLLSLKPNDEGLKITLTKGYAAYAFAVNETAYLNDYYSENEKIENLNQGIYNYSRAFEHGLSWLKQRGISYGDLQKAISTDNGVVQLLASHVGDDPEELEGVLFTAQSLAGLINFQKNNMSLVSQLPIAKGMFDYACGINPKLANGVCPMFFGAYEAGRPSMLGGNPAKGRDIFLKLIKEEPDNWLARIAYMQFYLIPQGDEDGYKTQRFYMEKYKQLALEEMKWNPNSKAKQNAAFKSKQLRFFQALAIERYNIISKYEKDLF